MAAGAGAAGVAGLPGESPRQEPSRDFAASRALSQCLPILSADFGAGWCGCGGGAVGESPCGVLVAFF